MTAGVCSRDYFLSDHRGLRDIERRAVLFKGLGQFPAPVMYVCQSSDGREVFRSETQ